VEIKSAATFSSSFLKGIDMFKKLNKSTSRTGYVMYDGEDDFETNDVRIRNISIHGLPEPLQG